MHTDAMRGDASVENWKLIRCVRKMRRKLA